MIIDENYRPYTDTQISEAMKTVLIKSHGIDPDNLRNAISEVVRGKMSIVKAGLLFGIPRKSLHLMVADTYATAFLKFHLRRLKNYSGVGSAASGCRLVPRKSPAKSSITHSRARSGALSIARTSLLVRPNKSPMKAPLQRQTKSFSASIDSPPKLPLARARRTSQRFVASHWLEYPKVIEGAAIDITSMHWDGVKRERLVKGLIDCFVTDFTLAQLAVLYKVPNYTLSKYHSKFQKRMLYLLGDEPPKGELAEFLSQDTTYDDICHYKGH